MDLARYKHISLEEAGQALTKVEAGSYRVLKSLGIELKAGATQTEALAAVEKIAAGQSVAYSKTLAGSMDVMNAKVEAAQAKIGKGLIPVLQSAAIAAGNLTDAITGGTRDTIQGLEQQTADMLKVGAGIDDWNAHLELLKSTEQDIRDGGGLWTTSEQDSLNRSITATEDAIAAQRKLGAAIRDTDRDISKIAISAPLAIKGLFGSDLAAAATGAIKYARREANLLGAAVAQGIRDKRSLVDTAWTDLLDGLKNSLSATKETAKLLGELVSKELVHGLHDGDPAVRAQARYTKQVILDRLEELRPRAGTLSKEAMDELKKGMKSKDPDIRKASTDIYNAATSKIKTLPTDAHKWGENFTKQYAAGILSKVDLVASAAGAISKALSNNLRASSPTKEGPLSTMGGPEGWGERIGSLFSKGLNSHLPDLSALGSPSSGSSGGGFGMSGGSSSGGLTIHIHGVSVLTPGAGEALARQLEPLITKHQQRQGRAPRAAGAF